MSTETPTAPPPDSRVEDFARFKRYAAITFLVASPILIALPPRKLDVYTASLASAFVLSGTHLSRDYVGRRWGDNLNTKLQGLPTEKAVEVQRQLHEQKAREARLRGEAVPDPQPNKGIAEQIWMGGETEGWKERRLREEQKALDEGKGYGDLIKEHVWDVWNWGKK